MSFELAGEVPVQAKLILGVGGFSDVREANRKWVIEITPHA